MVRKPKLEDREEFEARWRNDYIEDPPFGPNFRPGIHQRTYCGA